MKKMFLMALIALGLTAVSCSDDDKKETKAVIDANTLPEAAKIFVETHFAGITYIRVEKQSRPDDDGSIYDVYLSNGFEIDFDANGNWKDIDGNHQAIPTAIIPAPIAEYVTTNYALAIITTIEIEKHGYDIELSSDIDLVFNPNGEFVRVDN